jgi:hypothetical protein
LTKFHVTDSTNAIVGVINVANEQASDLQKCWRDSTPAAAPKQSAAVAALSAALRRGPRLSKAGVLRGC